MQKPIAALLLAALAACVPNARALTIPTVFVGNPGNSNDLSGFGAVADAYRIGTSEVTVGQYTAFLNAVAATDLHSLYNNSMATDLNSAGILRSGHSGQFTYSVIGSANKPVTYVSWGDAARFANWLHNGQPIGAQNEGSTENGAYPLNGAMSAAALAQASRSATAQWFLPTESEWYKAAYYQPAAQGGDADSYWQYPTKTNAFPISDQPPGAPGIQTNAANLAANDGNANGFNDGYAVTGSPNFDPDQNYLTDVGAYEQSSSFYGTFDQGGNVWEWNERLLVAFRGLRGGGWNSIFVDNLAATYPNVFEDPTIENDHVGFRVATIPEPSCAALAGMGLIGLGTWGWRRKR